MTLARLIPIHVHAALETALGPVLLVTPFALGFSPAALVASVALAVVTMGGALAAGSWLPSDGSQAPVRVSAHAGLDLVVASATAAFAVGFGLAGEPVAGGFFGIVAISLSLLAMTTRYATARA